MDLNVFEVIQGPVISKKATLLNQKFKKLILRVHPQANKMQIKQALQSVFNVKVEKVNTLNRVGKSYRVRRRIVQGSTTKRVIVTLKEGYSIDIFGKTEQKTVASE
ncbi:MAG TPA: 50S ribosomal protein L23 [Candidatus Babeliales bacterium]|nr:50S ribosomal protein L23 [Candidatus Babeliales bacterium]